MGYPHPDFLLRELTARQVAEWQAYYSIEPWGYGIENFRAGLLASVVANHSEISKRHDYTPHDFMPHEEARKETLADKIRRAFGVPRKR